MDEDIDRMLVSVRTDTAGFEREVARMRETLEGGLGHGADRAGRMIEASLVRAAASGKLGFDTLRKTALAALNEIGAAAIRLGIDALFGKSGGGGGGADTSIGTILSQLLGAPGRATGGPVSPGRAYVVGERGPELFVPTASGSIGAAGGSGAREVRVAITVNAATDAPGALRQSSRQVARAVKAALDG